MPQRGNSHEFGMSAETYQLRGEQHDSTRDFRFVAHEAIDNDKRYGPVFESLAPASDKLGATLAADGCTVAVRAGDAKFVDVCIFDEADSADSTGRFRLLPEVQRPGVFSGFVPGMSEGTLYGFRAHGDWDPINHKTYNYNKLLVDPYARSFTDGRVEAIVDGDLNDAILEHVDWHGNYQAPNEADSAPYVPKSVVVREDFDWSGEQRPRYSKSEMVIYEGHVRSLTKTHPDVPENLRGTYAGVAHPAFTTHLKELGVTSLELLPVQQSVSETHLQAKGLTNFWGYNTLGFFAPQAEYAASSEYGAQVQEFKQMVKELHAAGIEVILDVVYNHSPEGSEHGPTLSFKGLNSADTYLFGGDRKHTNYSGTGNTLQASNPATTEMILDSLRYWAEEMHVDGFRFDLATILAREAPYGQMSMDSPFMRAIQADPVLRDVKLIAEPWDCAGYAFGQFREPWMQWNDQFRDGAREFWHGGANAGAMAAKLAGSVAVSHAVNFVTAHDGFTLKDTVSYNTKHNHANGEDNRDGTDNNHSWNFGVEGETDDPVIREKRLRAMRSMILTLALANGVPMISHGDEILRTQDGNNNAYCQDNKTTWLNWNLTDEQAEFLDFTSQVFQFRARHPMFHRGQRFDSSPTAGRTEAELAWFKPDGREFMYGDEAWHRQLVGMYMSGIAVRETLGTITTEVDDSLLFYANGSHDDQEIKLPVSEPYQGEYELIFDTGTGEARREGEGIVIHDGVLCIKGLSAVLLRRLEHPIAA